LLILTAVAFVVVHVRSKPPPADAADVRLQVGAGLTADACDSANDFEQRPPGPVAVSVYVVAVVGRT
jgi:hypothetical protein